MKKDFPTFEGINTFTAKHACAHTRYVNTRQYVVTDRIRRQCTLIQNSDQLMSGGEAKNSPSSFNVLIAARMLIPSFIDCLFAEKQTTKNSSLFKISTYWHFHLICGWWFLLAEGRQTLWTCQSHGHPTMIQSFLWRWSKRYLQLVL